MEYILIPLFACFILYLGARILRKAGLNQYYVLLLLVPIINLAMIWVFAFTSWPNLKSDVKQDL